MDDVRSPEHLLLSPDDPAPLTVLNETSEAPFLFLCDHASNAVPAKLKGLGLLERDLNRHIAHDIGAAEMTRRLAERFDAPAVLSGYSRLVIDCNRQLGHPSSILTVSDGVEIPGNKNVGAEEAAERAEACFWPYHRRIGQLMDAIHARGACPAIVSIHSFTPVLGGEFRPWHIGVLWDEDDRMSAPLIDTLRGNGEIEVGDNEPYSGRARFGYSIEQHATATGYPGVLIEVREDLIAAPEDSRRIGDELGDALAPILADSGLYRRWVQP
jgi:predicted N-formylglutamate amidohydrolase